MNFRLGCSAVLSVLCLHAAALEIDHSALAPESLTTFAHLVISWRT
jgi:hypothetical protein